MRPASGAGAAFLGALLVPLLVSLPTGAAAQIGAGQDAPSRCELVDSRTVRSVAAGGGSRITYVSLPRIRCRDGTRLEADSAVVFEASGLTQLIGNVFYDDPESRLTAGRANYFEDQRRLRAWITPVLIDKQNRSVIRGDSLLLLRPGPTRQTGELTVTGERPHATLYPEWAGDTLPEAGPPRPGPDTLPPADTLAPPDTLPPPDAAATPDTVAAADTLPAPLDDPASALPGGPPPVEPYEVDADRLYFRGLEYMLATGDVVVERGDSLRAFADTLEFERDRSRMELREAARIERVDLSLEGRTVVLLLPDDEIREVTAREEAVLVAEDLRLDAETIRLFFEAQELERLVAVAADEAPGRARAVTEQYVLVADSVDVRSPTGQLERLTAVGSARAESTGREELRTPETPDVLRRDWLEGDTVVAFFEPVPPEAREDGPPDDDVGDPTADAAPDPPDADAPAANGPGAADERRYRLDELVATGRARSLYRIEPSDEDFEPGRDLPSASYVVGRSIRIVLVDEEVSRLEVEDLERGVHLEAAEPGAPADDGDGAGEGGAAPAEGGVAVSARGRAAAPAGVAPW